MVRCKCVFVIDIGVVDSGQRTVFVLTKVDLAEAGGIKQERVGTHLSHVVHVPTSPSHPLLHHHTHPLRYILHITHIPPPHTLHTSHPHTHPCSSHIAHITPTPDPLTHCTHHSHTQPSHSLHTCPNTPPPDRCFPSWMGDSSP